MTKTRPVIGPRSQAESFRSLDGRGVIARRMKATAAELAEALGGKAGLSPQQRIIIDIVSTRIVRCQMLTSAMLGGEGLSDEGERHLNWHLGSIRRDLQALGLDRRGERAPSLEQHLAAAYGKPA